MGKTKPGRLLDSIERGVQTAAKRPASARLPTLREIDIERQCSDLLALDGWRSLKTDPVSDRARGKGFGELGMADRLYIRYGLADTLLNSFSALMSDRAKRADAGQHPQMCEGLWIEWKRIRPGRRSATKSTAHQKTWQAAERARGALVLEAGVDFVPTFEDFAAWYRSSGLMRRPGLC